MVQPFALNQQHTWNNQLLGRMVTREVLRSAICHLRDFDGALVHEHTSRAPLGDLLARYYRRNGYAISTTCNDKHNRTKTATTACIMRFGRFYDCECRFFMFGG